jgi:Lung seven transmembrane receptor
LYFVLAIVYIFLLAIWSSCLCLYSKYSISVQKYWIPCILVLCILENMLNCSDWVIYNQYGSRNLVLLSTAVVIKAFKDSAGRVLLMAAAKGWGITEETVKSKLCFNYTIGILYFIFDLLYESVYKFDESIEIWELILISAPLIALNTIIFYLVFSWFSSIFYRLTFLQQKYKLDLLKQFASVLGFTGVISVVWGLAETLGRFFFKKDEAWQWGWVYAGIWDIIFLMLVISLMVIWRISTNSKLLAMSQELQDRDSENSKSEDKHVIELPSIK